MFSAPHPNRPYGIPPLLDEGKRAGSRPRWARGGVKVRRPHASPFLRHSVPPARVIHPKRRSSPDRDVEATLVRARPVVLLWRARPFSSSRSESLLAACSRCSLPTFAFALAFSFAVRVARVRVFSFLSWCRASHRQPPAYTRSVRVPPPRIPRSGPDRSTTVNRQTQKQTGFIQYTVLITRVVPFPNPNSWSRCLSLLLLLPLPLLVSHRIISIHILSRRTEFVLMCLLPAACCLPLY